MDVQNEQPLIADSELDSALNQAIRDVWASATSMVASQESGINLITPVVQFVNDESFGVCL